MANSDCEISNILKEEVLRSTSAARALVKSAVALSAQQQKQLSEVLEAKTKKKIHLDLVVEPSLIAGIQVSVLGKTMDGSLAACLDGLARKLKDMHIEGNA